MSIRSQVGSCPTAARQLAPQVRADGSLTRDGADGILAPHNVEKESAVAQATTYPMTYDVEYPQALWEGKTPSVSAGAYSLGQFGQLLT
jgi:hypothetical protein